MADEYLVTVELPHVNGLGEDAVQNSFAFNFNTPGPPDPADFDALAGRLSGFYNNTMTVKRLADYLSPELLRGTDVATIRFYDISAHLDGSPHGSPVTTRLMTVFASVASTALPSECAAVLTLRGLGWATAQAEQPDADVPPDALLDRPKQRKTGRLYIGPLNSTSTVMTASVLRLADAFRGDLLDAAAYLQDNAQTDGWDWSVWSRKDEALVPITDAQVDNAFDTQRRRGAAPTLRDTRVL